MGRKIQPRAIPGAFLSGIWGSTRLKNPQIVGHYCQSIRCGTADPFAKDLVPHPRGRGFAAPHLRQISLMDPKAWLWQVG